MLDLALLASRGNIGIMLPRMHCPNEAMHSCQCIAPCPIRQCILGYALPYEVQITLVIVLVHCCNSQVKHYINIQIETREIQ